MDTSLIKTFGQIAGIGGLALGVFLILFREVIPKNIFPNLEKRQAYLLLRLIIILVSIVTVLGIISCSFIRYTKKEGYSNNHGKEHLSLPKFEKEIYNGEDIDRLEQFINENLGKLVHINTEVPARLSEIGKTTDGRDELSLSSLDDCKEESFYVSCATSHLLINGKNHELGWYKGMHRFNGFFVIGETVEMHQGVYYSMESVPRAQVLIELQKNDRSPKSNTPIQK